MNSIQSWLGGECEIDLALGAPDLPSCIKDLRAKANRMILGAESKTGSHKWLLSPLNLGLQQLGSRVHKGPDRELPGSSPTWESAAPPEHGVWRALLSLGAGGWCRAGPGSPQSGKSGKWALGHRLQPCCIQ